VGFAQILQRGIEINNRISGFNDMYMTYAGLLMLAIMFALALALFTFNKWRDAWIPIAIAIMVAAVLLSLTRNAWIGLFAGGSLLLVLRKPISIVIIPVALAIGLAAAPGKVRDRALSMFDKNQKSNRERIYLWGAGLKIIKDNPVFGVGQNSFPLVYPKYRHPDVKEPNISHLHNNFLELAAERGLVGLFCWSLIWAGALWIMLRAWILAKVGDRERIMTLAASISGAVAFLTAGMFEYNFGDSEVQMLYYFLLAAGLAAASENVEKQMQ
jgi:O-antigen ligase